MILLEECIDVLKKEKDFLEYDELKSEELFETLQKNIKFTEYGKVDFEGISYIKANSLEELNLENIKILIFWDEMSLPVLQTNINSVIKYLDDVLAVSFQTWLVSLDFKYIIEYSYDSSISTNLNITR